MEEGQVATSPELELLDKLQTLLKTFKPHSSDRKQTRNQACSLARLLFLSLEEPGDLIDRVIYQPQENALLRLGLDLGIYDLLTKAKKPLTAEVVAKEVKADPLLTERIVRVLTALHHIDETPESSKEGLGYVSNKFTHAFTTLKGISAAKVSFEFAAPAWNQIPSFLASISYQNPTDPMDTPLQRAFPNPDGTKSEKHFFQLLEQTGISETFQTFMSTYRADRAEFLDVYPAEERLVKGFDGEGEGVVFVDVGGGHGHEVVRFGERFKEVRGRLVLQDQEEVLKQMGEDEGGKGVEKMVYDFFTPQLIKGARAYYFRMIFHDWPDDKCIEILKNTASAMRAGGYSKLLINDIVLPDRGTTRFAAQSDITMMAVLGSMERSEAQWRKLIEGAGLEVGGFWLSTPESVIEAVLPA